MTTIFHFADSFKSTRSFGRGILQSLPAYRADHTAADEEWLAADNARREQENRRLDQMAGEFEAINRNSSGICC